MNYTRRTALIVTLLLLSAACSDRASWNVVHTQGVLHFVYIDDRGSLEESLYRSAAEEICGRKRICQVLFWNERELVPTRTPMTRSQERAKVAHWSYNANTGLRQLAWSCSIKQQSGCF